MEELEKMLSHSKSGSNSKNNIAPSQIPRKSDSSSKNSQFVRRASVTNMSFARNYLNQDSKKFIQNIICSTSVGRKETFPKLVLFHLES